MNVPDTVLTFIFENGRLLPPGGETDPFCPEYSDQQISVVIPPGQTLTVVEQHTGSRPDDAPLHRQMTLERDAHLHYLVCQQLDASATLTGSLTVSQQESSCFQAGFFSSGSLCEKQTIAVRQTGPHADCLLYGLCQPVQDGQSLLHEADVQHLAAFGKSRMLFRGLLAGKSRAFFQGRVTVSPLGQGAVVRQGSHYLLLSEGAEAGSRPELEICQDEVMCSHGATIGQLDDAALFYLRSRGIERSLAEKMLQAAFVADVLGEVPPSLQPWLFQTMGYDHADFV